MKSDITQNRSQKTIINELESIKGLLDGDMEEIPVLDEMVSTPATGTRQAKSREEEQQHLFEPHPDNPPPVAPTSENPFLPKHIRERLNSESPLARRSKQLESKLNQPDLMPAPPPKAKAPKEDIVNQLVAKYMPKIEAELRRRLKEKLK